MNENLQIIFGLLGGLAVFLFGMNMMSECLQKAAGEKMKSILSLLTKNPVMGVIAGAQKNVGPAGVTIVIVREDLIGSCPADAPVYLDYKIHAEKGSMYNTPPCYSIYMAGLMFQWIKKQGGVPAVQKHNEEQAAALYDFIDNSSFYNCPVAFEDRSLMNVVFVTGDEDLDKKFIAEAKTRGLVNLAGHRTVGGMRASIYNAMPDEGVKKLIDFMKKFETDNR